MAQIKWRRCRGWCQTADDELIRTCNFITSIGDLLTLFEFQCLEYQVFILLSSLCWEVFIITVIFFKLTLIFLASLFCCSLLCLFLCLRCLCITRIEIYQVGCKESLHQLNKVVKSVSTVRKWIPYLKSIKVSKVLQ